MFITITAQPAPANTPAVPARFVMMGEEILVNGTVLAVRENLDGRNILPGMRLIVCRDTELRQVVLRVDADAWITLYDRVEADAQLADALRAL